MAKPYIPFKCPSCSEPLSLQERSWLCVNNHCFDVAKEGYVNLHLVHQKNSKQPGDSEAMMKSRRAFLNRGYYQILAERLAALLPENCQNLLDLGCGEGFYLQQIIQARPEIQTAGIDISKAGIRMTAKRKTSAQIAVASAYDLPFFDASFDAAISIFSPIHKEETARILKPGGLLIAVGPGPRHLEELAALVYETPSLHKPGFREFIESETFDTEHSETLHYTAELTGDDSASLLQMTPYYWHARSEQIQHIESLQRLGIQFQFDIQLFRKIA